jgi:glutathione synthase/RimK-type ligase-like ATP-grasp enzyme
MLPSIGFLACPGTLPGSPHRRADAHEHDLQVDALRPHLSGKAVLRELDWRDEAAADCDLVLLGTSWDYARHCAAFLARLDALEESGVIVCNPARMVRWNVNKRYLIELAARGVPVIETLWLDRPTRAGIAEAFSSFGTDTLVVKHQVGAGAVGQGLLQRERFDPADWQGVQPVMVQPFCHSVAAEGEYSFVFVAGALSHALVKLPARDDYRVQSLYGGVEHPIEPDSEDLAAAQAVLPALPFDTPTYARIDMLRGAAGDLLLIEAELIEPYLYPVQGLELGKRLASALLTLLDRGPAPN